MTCAVTSKATKFKATSVDLTTITAGRNGLKLAAAITCAGLLAGCSSASIGSPGSPSYLGARDVPPPAHAAEAAPSSLPRVTSSKVLSAVVFERVTGLEVDPARLIDR